MFGGDAARHLRTLTQKRRRELARQDHGGLSDRNGNIAVAIYHMEPESMDAVVAFCRSHSDEHISDSDWKRRVEDLVLHAPLDALPRIFDPVTAAEQSISRVARGWLAEAELKKWVLRRNEAGIAPSLREALQELQRLRGVRGLEALQCQPDARSARHWCMRFCKRFGVTKRQLLIRAEPSPEEVAAKAGSFGFLAAASYAKCSGSFARSMAQVEGAA